MSNDSLPPLTDPALYPRVPDAPPRQDRGRNAKGGAVAGIVAAGALAVGIGVAVTSHASASSQGGPGAQGGTTTGQGPGGFGAPGGTNGGQLVMGTVTAVGSDSVTVRTTATTTTYTVSSSTQVVVDGAAGTLSAVKAGATVLVQVPATGSTTTATRIIVGAVGGTGGGHGGFGGAPPGQQAPVTT